MNRFQRVYFRWAAPYYAKMPPDVRRQAEAIDRLLYSRRGLGAWLGLAGAVVGTTAGFAASGLPFWAALGTALLIVVSFGLAGVGVWLMPSRYSGWWVARVTLVMLAGAYCGMFVAVAEKKPLGSMSAGEWLETFAAAAVRATPIVVVVVVMFVGVLLGAASARRYALQRELQQSKLEAERDAAARDAAEARLRLLQAQIQPHFIFNTLAALQHWIDTADARAGGLLRSLTGFLRGSTELMGRERIALGEELALVEHYLAIAQARLGERLAWRIEPGAEAAGLRTLPPGLVLTLVENAVEHGVAPQLAGGRIDVQVSLDDDATLDIAVLDTGAGLPAGWRDGASDGVGLANCRARLAHAFGAGSALTIAPRADGSRGTEARLRLAAPAPTDASSTGTTPS